MPDINVTVETSPFPAPSVTVTPNPIPALSVGLGILPAQTGQAGRFLATNGTVATWTESLTGKTLGNAAGASVLSFGLGTNTGNNSRLEVSFLRHTNGGDWTTATTRLQSVVDVTSQAYIDFNPPGEPYGLGLGVGTDSGASVEVFRFKKNGADVVRPYTGFSYNSYASQHVAFTKKAGTYSYYFRKSDTGASDGPNLATLFEVRDNGDIWNPGAAYCGFGYVLNDYAQTRWTTGSGKGWRAYTDSAGATFGDFYLQGSNDSFVSSFVTPFILRTNGDVHMPGGVLTGQRFEINYFAAGDQPGYIDIHAQPGSDADTRIWRDAGANGGFAIQNGGTGNLGFYAGGTAGQPWTANKGFHINGTNGTLYLTSGLALENHQAINFRDAGGSFPAMLTQTDNNFVFYGTNSTGGARSIFGCFMRSDSSAFHLRVPLKVSDNGAEIKGIFSALLENYAPPAIAANGGTQIYDVTVTGVKVSDAVNLTTYSNPGPSRVMVEAFVPMADKVRLVWTNYTAASVTFSTAVKYRMLVFSL